MGELSILNRKGHTAVTWDEAKPETVEKARQTYQEFLAQGFAMFVASPTAPAKQIDSFDPTAERIFGVGPYVGG
jgi:hypothetical protein